MLFSVTLQKTSPNGYPVGGTRTPPIPRLKERCPEGYVTRATLLERTGVSDPDLKSWEQKGLVRADARNDRGWYLWKEERIETLRHLAASRPTRIGSIRRSASEITYTSKEAVTIFGLIRDRVSLVDIVTRTEIHPAIVQVIARDFQSLGDAIVLLEDDIQAIRAAKLDAPEGTFRSAADLVTAIKGAFSRMACQSCKERPRSKRCERCIEDRRAALERRAARQGVPAPADGESETDGVIEDEQDEQEG